MKSVRKVSGWNILILVVLALVSFVCIFPFYYVFIVSLADPVALINTKLYVLPTTFTLESYSILFEDGSIMRGALVSVFTTGLGTMLSIVIITMAGYALSKKYMPMRRSLLTYVLVTMFIGVQTIPYYILIRNLNLMNSIWVLIVPMLVDPFYLIIVKNYFLGIPAGLEESARIDGANDFTILFRIVIPISVPLIASVTLFLAVNKWNEWWHAMLFLSDRKIWPMQMMLREILSGLENSGMSQIGQMMAARRQVMSPQNVRMAVIMVTCLPILLAYPFIQKYLTQGLMLGSIKE